MRDIKKLYQNSYVRRNQNTIVWIMCLAFLSVGARNFENGLSLDAPLYATIARNIARTGEWFQLDGSIPEFRNFADHPHLGFWLQALVFKLCTPADWSARIVGHLSYVTFLGLFYTMVRRWYGSLSAACGVLCLWIWPVFGNFFSSFYLDAPFLIFASVGAYQLGLSLFDDRHVRRHAIWCGLFVALAIMTKGLAWAGFAPLHVVLVGYAFYKKRPALLPTLLALTTMILVLGIYVLAVSRSAQPDFLHRYWARQVTDRFGHSSSISKLFNLRFYTTLLRDTHWLGLLALIGIAGIRKDIRRAVPTVLLVSFISIYALKDRIEGQYWLSIMPWIAWLIVCWLPKAPAFAQRLKYSTGAVAVLSMCLLQYLPFRTHFRNPPAPAEALVFLNKHGVPRLEFAQRLADRNFIQTAPYAWFGQVTVDYVEPDQLPSPSADTSLLTFIGAQDAEISAAALGWCELRHYEDSRLWVSCAEQKTQRFDGVF